MRWYWRKIAVGISDGSTWSGVELKKKREWLLITQTRQQTPSEGSDDHCCQSPIIWYEIGKKMPAPQDVQCEVELIHKIGEIGFW